MIELNPHLLLSSEFAEELSSSPINGTKARGVYNPMQFVLRLREDVHKQLEEINPGVSSGSISDDQIQAFSTYLHETIHWWQHVGSNFVLISSLKFPAQTHIVHSDLKALLNNTGAFKSIIKFDSLYPENIHVNKVLNYWHDIEFAGQIAFDHKRMFNIANNPYFDCWGHSYHIMWASAIWTLGSTFDKEFSFLPNIKKWDEGFKELKEKKVQGFYYGSPNGIPPIGTKAIFEGQARFSQLQYLSRAFNGKGDLNDFEKAGMLKGIYVEAFDLFLRIIGESTPSKADDPLIGLFLLVCDIAVNPTDGFPFDITQYESFVFLNDPGYRFLILCQMIRDKHPQLKSIIREYSKEEYVAVSAVLAKSISCFSPYESANYVLHWIKKENIINELLQQEVLYKYSSENLPIRLFFSKFLRFQEDKFKYPQLFCWPGMNFAEIKGNTVNLSEVYRLFEKHKALFIDDVNGNIYHSAIDNYTEKQIDETFNDFYAWNASYDMVRKWINEEGPFTFNYEWLTSKFSRDQMRQWASNNFESSFGVSPDEFKIL